MVHNRKELFYLPFLCALTMLFAFSTEASAANSEQADPFANYNNLMSHVRSQGIEPSKIDWGPFNAICLDIKTAPGEDERPFNKCLYEKLKESIMHKADKEQCSIRAKATYLDSFTTERKDTLKETDKDGVVHTFERTSPPVSSKELLQLRAAFIIDCMQKSGWANTDDWKLGRRTSCD